MLSSEFCSSDILRIVSQQKPPSHRDEWANGTRRARRRGIVIAVDLNRRVDIDRTTATMRLPRRIGIAGSHYAR
jgi:hypothetical protein